MTKKDFEAMATAWGRELGEASASPFWTEERAGGFWQGVRAMYPVLEVANPRFDRSRFESWVIEVATGVRDLDGRKVKVSA